MDARLGEKRSVAEKTLDRLAEILANEKNPITRDAAIQRFEFTFEALWKYTQFYLKIKEGMDLASPKSIIRALFQLHLFDEQQTQLALSMADDRNLTTHTYDEEFADKIYAKLAQYLELMQTWYQSLK